eukprot:TRINITY_DN9721_c1_g1_i1.p1 TRINITY_DN9721_c1_g1~~TRINITY_DN9721_c1_g1_i1.p1  ORF type:complete len:443 (-),score=52.55 TRINITY_DN9721_c1_g1_i1:1693-3021(-)
MQITFVKSEPHLSSLTGVLPVCVPLPRSPLPQLKRRKILRPVGENQHSHSTLKNGHNLGMIPTRVPSEVDQIKKKVDDLQQTLEKQQQIIEKQEKIIDSLVTGKAPWLYQQQTNQHPLINPNPLSDNGNGSQPNRWDPSVSPFQSQLNALGDRRQYGMYDARYHSTSPSAIPPDFRVLPERIILVRHAESEGNVDMDSYSFIPDPKVPVTDHGKFQAQNAGQRIKELLEKSGNKDYKLYFFISPYRRSVETFQHLKSVFSENQIDGVQEEVQLREQDFGNFQDPLLKQREKEERLRFGRFFYRFPNGESGADVYDRITIFEDHLVRDINAGRFGRNTTLVLVTHGLALRVFLMRWFHWTVDQFLQVYNPPNAELVIMERAVPEWDAEPHSQISWVHTKTLYKLTEESQMVIRGCTDDMCQDSNLPFGLKLKAHKDQVESKCF